MNEHDAVPVSAEELKGLCDAVFVAREWIAGNMLYHAIIKINPEQTLGQYIDNAIKIAAKVTP